MTADKNAMKAEALERMSILKLHPNIIKEFECANKLNYSYSVLGFLYWLTDETQARVDKFEKETGYLVYHVIENDAEIGRLITFLYVSTTTDEWESERKNLRDGCPIGYVVNTDDENCSEFGSVGIKSLNGGVVRTA